MKNFFSKKNNKWLLLTFFAVAAICCAMVIFLYLPSPKGGWNDRELGICEGISGELSGRRFKIISRDGVTLWETPRTFLVQDVLVTDLDRDGETEIILLLWKIGKFGKHRPFWVERDELAFSQHVFIYSVSREGKLRHRWGASEVGDEITRMKLMEKNNSLLLTEAAGGKCAVWRWDSFGLKTIDSSVSFVVFGDNIIHREIYEYADKSEGGSFDFLYEPFYDDIRNADIAAFQQETMLVDKKAAVAGYPLFGAPIRVGEAIAEAGFDIASCAGNHALDRGIYGIDVTTSFYREKGITCLGVQESGDLAYRPYETVSKNGITFAMFDYTYGTGEMDVRDRYPFAVHYLPRNEAEEKELIKDLESARNEADFVIVFVHWGNEYETKLSDAQLHMADVFARGGADVVLGTHPHVVQDVETVKRPDGGNMLIYYSLGNFRAHQGQSPETKSGGIARFEVGHTYDGAKLLDYNLDIIDSYMP